MSLQSLLPRISISCHSCAICTGIAKAAQFLLGHNIQNGIWWVLVPAELFIPGLY